MTEKYLGALTPATSGSYPPFINFTQVDGRVRVLARGEPKGGKCGGVVEMTLSRDEFVDLLLTTLRAIIL